MATGEELCPGRSRTHREDLCTVYEVNKHNEGDPRHKLVLWPTRCAS